jgi:hypothetical protein
VRQYRGTVPLGLELSGVAGSGATTEPHPVSGHYSPRMRIDQDLLSAGGVRLEALVPDLTGTKPLLEIVG